MSEKDKHFQNPIPSKIESKNLQYAKLLPK